MYRHALVFICFFMSLVSIGTSSAMGAGRETLAGPLTGSVIDVRDGDTFNIRVHVWIGQNIETNVRINGIDTPELHGKCEKERSMAQRARQELVSLIADKKVRLYNVRYEKYAGRVLADVETIDGVKISDYLIEKGFARTYHGEKRKPWCADL